MARTLQRVLRRLGHDFEIVDTLADANPAILAFGPDVVLLDIGMPDGCGLDRISALVQMPGEPTVVVLTGRCDLQATVKAIHRGAMTCLTKPFSCDELAAVLDRVRTERGDNPHRRVAAWDHQPTATEMLAARSVAMRRVFVDIARATKGATTTLVTGETGVGKELVARAIYEACGCSGPFIALNCAAVSPSLFEAELFGHRRGAFSGAEREQIGRIEAAQDGVLFLDEVGELAPDLQAKLLRVLQERTFERVGETEPRPVAARVVAATNRDLAADVKAGRFREDLLYRLLMTHIDVPPLRDRATDFPFVLDNVLAELAREANLDAITVSTTAEQALAEQCWPGNVRQLANTLHRIVVAGNEHVTLDLVQAAIEADPTIARPQRRIRSLADAERQHILGILEETRWTKRRAAAILGISRSRLDRKIAEYGLAAPGTQVEHTG